MYEVLDKIKYRYFIIGILAGLCMTVMIGLLFPTNNISTDIMVIFCIYIYPFLLIIHVCQKYSFSFWKSIEPVKFQPIRELALPIIMSQLLHFGLLLLMAAVFMSFIPETNLDETNETVAVWNPTMKLLMLVVLAPFFEEIVFRWYLFNKIAVKGSPLKATLLSSLIFGILHFENAVPTSIVGIVLCVVYAKYKNLFPCIIIHLFNNVLVFIVQFAMHLSNDTNTSMSELPAAAMLLMIAAVLLAISLIWFICFWKKNRQYLANYRTL
jgi:membrane protease YdiL (CAAX protease family)